jgi:hypothetical protein
VYNRHPPIFQLDVGFCGRVPARCCLTGDARETGRG